MWLLRAETAFFPCFFLPPPPSYENTATRRHACTTPTEDPRDPNTFVLWGLTFGVVSDLAVAGGGRPFAYQAPPYFRLVWGGVFLGEVVAGFFLSC